MNDQYPSLCDGRYIVTHCIGSGGMGAVFRCYDQRLKVDRAVKILRPELVSRPDKRQRFTREAVAMAQLNHPNVVQIFDYGQEALTLFIIMEYLPLDSLQGYLDTIGALNRGQAARVCLEVAQGLQFMHQKGIIHRDVKPANILLATTGVKVGDFGLVRSDVDQLQTHSQAVMGTFAFMSPEQRLGAKDVTHQTDIYALAASMYVMLTTQSPLHLHHDEERSRLLADIDPLLANILDKGLQADVSKRYASIDEMLSDLEDVLGKITEDSHFHLSDVEVRSEPQDLAQLMEAWYRFTSLDTMNSMSSGVSQGYPPRSSSASQSHRSQSSYLLSQQIEGVDVDVLLAPTYVPEMPQQTYAPQSHLQQIMGSSSPLAPSSNVPHAVQVPPTDPPEHSPTAHTSSKLEVSIPPTDPPSELPLSAADELPPREQIADTHRESTPPLHQASAQPVTSSTPLPDVSEQQKRAGLNWERILLISIVIGLGIYGVITLFMAPQLQITTQKPVATPLLQSQQSIVITQKSQQEKQQSSDPARSPLEQVDSLSPRELIQEAERALFEGKYHVAEHFLYKLRRKNNYNADAYAMLSLTSFMRGQTHLYGVYSHLAARATQETSLISTSLASLMDESRRQREPSPDLDQRWRSALDQTARPAMTLAQLITTHHLWSDLTETQLKNAQGLYGNPVVLRHLGLIWKRQSDHAMYAEAMKQVCRHDQETPSLLIECAELAEMRGDFTAARDFFTTAKRLDASLGDSYAGLLISYARADDRIKSQSNLLMGLADQMWPREQLRLIQKSSQGLPTNGMVNEGAKFLGLSSAGNVYVDHVHIAAHCIRNTILASLWLERDDQIPRQRDLLTQLLDRDDLDPQMRMFNTLFTFSVDAEIAARGQKWKRFAELESLIDRVDAREDALQVKDQVQQRLAFLRLIHQAKRRVIKKALATRQKQQESSRLCLSVYEDAQLLKKMGDSKREIKALLAVMGRRCVHDVFTPHVRNHAAVDLAERLLAQKRRREAQDVIQTFLKRWSRADAELRLFKRAQAIFKSL